VKTPRFAWLDILRAFGVIGVVVFHAAGPPEITGLITPWFLGVFFFASGYTYKDDYTTHPWALAKKRFFTLYVPFVGWQLAYLTLHDLFFKMSILSDKVGYLNGVSQYYGPMDFFRATRAIVLMRAVENMGGALWFITALISVNALFCLLSVAGARLFGGREWARAAMVLALVAIAYTNQTLVTYPLYLNFSLLCVLFFYAGYLYRRHEALVPNGMLPSMLAAVALYLGRGTILGLTVTGNPVLIVATVMAGVYLVLQISKAIGSKPFLEYVGRNSLAIIAMHFLAFKLVSLAIVQVRGLPAYALATFPVIAVGGSWWVAYALVGLLVPVAVKLGFDFAARRIRPPAAESAALRVSPEGPSDDLLERGRA
jgi:fucose 4-O-acetylase-like acetyltransferase